MNDYLNHNSNTNNKTMGDLQGYDMREKIVLVLVLIVISVHAAGAQEVIRGLPSKVDSTETISIVLTSNVDSIGVKVVENYPPEFQFLNWSYHGADNVEFSKNDGQLNFTVTDINSDGFNITYQLTTPEEGSYSFRGVYQAVEKPVEKITGDNNLEVIQSESTSTPPTETPTQTLTPTQTKTSAPTTLSPTEPPEEKEKITLRPHETNTESQTPATPTLTAKKSTPGFEIVFSLTGLMATSYWIKNKNKNKNKK